MIDKCDFCGDNRKRIAPKVMGCGLATMGAQLHALIDDATKPVDGIRLDGVNLIMWDNSYGEYAELGTLINYCPMCGRYLRADNEEELK